MNAVPLIFNPAAGGGHGHAQLAARVAELFAAAGESVEPRPTERAGHAADIVEALARERGAEGTDVIVLGGDGTLNVSSANLLTGTGARDSHRSGGGAIFRMVATFDEDGTPRATVNFPPGNVEDRDSPLWSNTLDDWVAGRYQPLLFDRAEIEAASTAVSLP